MYCTYCGKKIPDDGEFCPYCGRSNKTGTRRDDDSTSRFEPELQSKRFDFGMFESNDSSINEINAWLSEHRIVISSISFLAHLNGTHTRTNLSQCEINFHDYWDCPYIYQVNCFSDYHWISANHSELDEQLDSWKHTHPDCKVVYYTHIGHQYSGGNTMSLYFLYRRNFSESKKNAFESNAEGQENWGSDNKENPVHIYSSMDEVMGKAKNGDHVAQYFLADCYCNGRGVECNKRTAASWMKKSAEQGYDVAQYELGLYYLNGTGVEQDDFEAVKWFTEAAWQGNAEAEYNLGLCYAQGRGVTFTDSDVANNWFSKARQHGFNKNAPKKEIAKIKTKRAYKTKMSITTETDGTAQGLKYCTNCGSPLNEGAKFCSNCGAPVIKAE